MPARTTKKRPNLSYNELKLSGRFSAETVETFVETAVAISLRRKYDPRIVVPIENLYLYDVSHQDTGEDRLLGKSYGNVPVYETTRRRLNAKPLLGTLALSGVSVERLGHSGSRFAVYGVIGVDRLGLTDLVDLADQTQANEVLAKNTIVQIFGNINGRQVDFGDPTPLPAPNRDYDGLVTLGAFNDRRFVNPSS